MTSTLGKTLHQKQMQLLCSQTQKGRAKEINRMNQLRHSHVHEDKQTNETQNLCSTQSVTLYSIKRRHFFVLPSLSSFVSLWSSPSSS